MVSPEVHCLDLISPVYMWKNKDKLKHFIWAVIFFFFFFSSFFFFFALRVKSTICLVPLPFAHLEWIKISDCILCLL